MTSYPDPTTTSATIPAMPAAFEGWTTYGGRPHRTLRPTLASRAGAAERWLSDARTAPPTLAAERQAGYDLDPAADPAPAADVASAADPAAATSSGDGSVEESGVPFGLPVLAQVPRLAAALEAIDGAERRMLDAVVVVAELLADDEVAHTTGVPVEHWLAIVCRQTRMDRRLLLRLARLLGRFPALAAGVRDGRVSFAQLRGLGIVLRQAPSVIDLDLDDLLVLLLDELGGADPDVLIDQVRRAIVELVTPVTAEECDRVSNSLWLQPNLNRTGGRFGGELDTLGMAIVDETTAPRRDQRDHPGGLRGARADNLLARLVNPDAPDLRNAAGHDPDGHAGHEPGRNAGHEPGRNAGHDPGRNAGHDDPDADDTGDPGTGTPAGDGGQGSEATSGDDDHGADAAGRGGRDRGAGGRLPWRVQAGGLLPPVKLLVRVQLETLGALPADVLTRLTGGHLKLSSQAATWLLDRQGVQLRTVVIDQGEVVGVGRQTRVPPGWMADVVAAVHDTCTAPLCDRPARAGQLDHAQPWWPTGPDEAFGTTDVTNVGPLCDSTNKDKERSGWKVHQTGDGRRTWTHARTGLSITTVPGTWRPTGWEPIHQHRPDGPPPDPGSRPGGTDPPDPDPPDPDVPF
jgi:hypothetical protein